MIAVLIVLLAGAGSALAAAIVVVVVAARRRRPTDPREEARLATQRAHRAVDRHTKGVTHNTNPASPGPYTYTAGGYDSTGGTGV
jgi:hypothetical protein